MNRRKTKTERELCADLRKTTLIFCNNQGTCKTCPLRSIKEAKEVGCIVAYLIWLMEWEEE